MNFQKWELFSGSPGIQKAKGSSPMATIEECTKTNLISYPMLTLLVPLERDKEVGMRSSRICFAAALISHSGVPRQTIH